MRDSNDLLTFLRDTTDTFTNDNNNDDNATNMLFVDALWVSCSVSNSLVNTVTINYSELDVCNISLSKH